MNKLMTDGVSLALLGVIAVATFALLSRNGVFRGAVAAWFVAP